MSVKRGNYRQRVQDLDQISMAELNNPWTFHSLFSLEISEVIRWLRNHDLLAKSFICPNCKVVCHDRKKPTSIDGIALRCSHNRNHEYSVRVNSFFSRSHFTFPDIMQFYRCFVEGQSLLQCAATAGIDYKRSAVDWASYGREIYKEYILRHVLPIKFSGEIEIDESHFCRKVKHHRGDVVTKKSVWVFGMVERSTNRLLLFPVEKRDKTTLVTLIKRHVEPGSTIYSDGWAAYSGLNREGFRHFTVIHKESFRKTYVHKESGQRIVVHTNTIEGAWQHAKSHFVRICGTNLSNFEGHLCEVLFRNHVRMQERFSTFWNTVQHIYSLEAPAQYTYEVPLFDTWAADRTDLNGSSFWEEEEETVAPSPQPAPSPYSAPASIGQEIVNCPPAFRPEESSAEASTSSSPLIRNELLHADHPNVTKRRRRCTPPQPSSSSSSSSLPITTSKVIQVIESAHASDDDFIDNSRKTCLKKKQKVCDFSFSDSD